MRTQPDSRNPRHPTASSVLEEILTGFPEYQRLFTAVLLDPEIRNVVREEARLLLDGAGRIGLVPEENLHVTLKFIGDVHREDLPALLETLSEAGPLLAEGEIEVSGFGAFPGPQRPRVIWAGVSDPRGILTPVHARLSEMLVPFGAKRERKRYVPHITVGRVRGPFDATLFRERLGSREEAVLGVQAVDAFALVMSEMEHGRPPVYSVLGRFGPGG